MKYFDLLRMSASNLLRRKLRTALTVLGVIIGTASIVVMVSLGLGLRKSSLEQIEEYGGLTTINVSSGSYYYDSSSSSDSSEPQRIDDKVVETLAAIPHVEIASPVLEMNVLARQGAYEGWLWVRGMSQEAIQKMDLDIKEGTLPPSSEEGLQFFYGNQVITNFYNAKTNDYYWDTEEVPEVDLME